LRIAPAEGGVAIETLDGGALEADKPPRVVEVPGVADVPGVAKVPGAAELTEAVIAARAADLSVLFVPARNLTRTSPGAKRGVRTAGAGAADRGASVGR
jgi:hypothetical protein